MMTPERIGCGPLNAAVQLAIAQKAVNWREATLIVFMGLLTMRPGCLGVQVTMFSLSLRASTVTTTTNNSKYQ